MLTFKDWVARFETHKTPAGMLAKWVVRHSENFPASQDRDAIAAYLADQKAADQIRLCFVAMWDEFETDKHKIVRESVLESRLIKEVEKRGGKAKKFVSPGWAGVPDRIILIPPGRTIFVEMKAPGRKPKPLQVKRMNELRAMGYEVYCIDRPSGIEAFLLEVFGSDLQTS